MPHFDLLIRNGTVVLPWGEAVTDIGVREGRIAALGIPGTADETCRRRPGCTSCPG